MVMVMWNGKKDQIESSRAKSSECSVSELWQGKERMTTALALPFV